MPHGHQVRSVESYVRCEVVMVVIEVLKSEGCEVYFTVNHGVAPSIACAEELGTAWLIRINC